MSGIRYSNITLFELTADNLHSVGSGDAPPHSTPTQVVLL